MSILESLQVYSSLFLSKSTPLYERELLHKINLKNRIIGVVGAKGVGKTTLLLQFMKRQNLSPNEMIYISVDHPLMSSTTILDIAKEFASFGGKLLVLDEIHSQSDFANDLKTIWDFLEVNIIFSGSSALHLDGADLSRRAIKYHLPTLSFREFLEIETDQKFEKLTLEEITRNHTRYATDILYRPKETKKYQKNIDDALHYSPLQAQYDHPKSRRRSRYQNTLYLSQCSIKWENSEDAIISRKSRRDHQETRKNLSR